MTIHRKKLDGRPNSAAAGRIKRLFAEAVDDAWATGMASIGGTARQRSDVLQALEDAASAVLSEGTQDELWEAECIATALRTIIDREVTVEGFMEEATAWGLVDETQWAEPLSRDGRPLHTAWDIPPSLAIWQEVPSTFDMERRQLREREDRYIIFLYELLVIDDREIQDLAALSRAGWGVRIEESYMFPGRGCVVDVSWNTANGPYPGPAAPEPD